MRRWSRKVVGFLAVSVIFCNTYSNLLQPFSWDDIAWEVVDNGGVGVAVEGKALVKRHRFVVWTYPLAPSLPDHDEASQQLLQLDTNDVLICPYQSACPNLDKKTQHEDIFKLLLTDDGGRHLNLRVLTKDTPYFGAILNHTMQKVLHRSNYSDHLQSIVVLALLHKFPGVCVKAWGDTTVLCQHNLTQFESYDPTLADEIAPLIPTSRPPDNAFPKFHALTYGMGDGWGGNSGDEIQSIAHSQFFPYISDFQSRSRGWPRATGNVIGNAWYGFTFKFPPREKDLSKLNATFVAMHVAGRGQDSVNHTSGLEYLKHYNKYVGPLGARDAATLRLFQHLNVTAFLSRCLTMMIQNGCNCRHCESNCPTKNEIVMNDVNMTLLPDHVQEQLKKEGALKLTAVMRKSDNKSILGRFRYAQKLLYIYAHRAKVVITSRLHCALPSLALGVPVIFVDSKATALVGGSRARLDGIWDLLRIYRPGDDWVFDFDNMSPNPGVHVADRNRAAFWNYLKRQSSYYEDAARLHGVIPYQRLGLGVENDPHFAFLGGDFHFVLDPDWIAAFSESPQTTLWRFVRAIEHVFFHHPNANVRVHYTTSGGIPAFIGSKLKVFPETGYSLEVESVELPKLLEETVGGVGGIYNSVQIESELVALLVLCKYKGVVLAPDTYLLETLPRHLEDVYNSGVLLLGGWGSKKNGYSVLTLGKDDENHINYLMKCVQDRFQSSAGTDNDAGGISTQSVLQSLQSQRGDYESSLIQMMAPESFVVLQDEHARNCFESNLNVFSSSSSPSRLAVQVDFFDTKDIQQTAPGSSCDDILHKFCILCDELHTRGRTIALPYQNSV